MKRRLQILLLAFALSSCTMLVSKFAYYPDTKTCIPSDKLPSFVHLLEMPTEDGIAIQALHFRHEGAANEKTLVVYFHGNAGNMYHRIDEAKRLYDMGTDVLIVSYRGYAGSRGEASESGSYKDGRAALAYAQAKLAFGPEAIILYGRSIGTTVAVDVSQGLDLRGMILVTPLSNGYDMGEKMGMGSAASIASASFDSIGKIVNARCPLLVLHGTADEVIPYSLGKKLFDAYGGEKRFVTITGGGHNDLEFVDPETYWTAIRLFVAGTAR